MSVVQHPSNPKWWQIKYYPEGRKGGLKVKVLKGGTYEEAVEIELLLRREARGSIKNIKQIPQIAEAIPYFYEFYKLDHLPSGAKLMARYLKNWSEEIGALRFPEITPALIEEYKKRRILEGIKPITINKELTALQQLCKWAQNLGYCNEITVKRFPSKMTTSPKPSVPTREEVLALINCMIWPKCGLFACLYYGGLRTNEARMLRVRDVHLAAKIMVVLGKGNKERPVPIVPELEPWFRKRLAEVKSGLLWTTRNGKPIYDLKKIVKLAKKRANLDVHIYPHLLRHAFGVHAVTSGVGMRHLQKIMGHKSVKTTEIYTELGGQVLIDELAGKFGNRV